VRTVEARIVRPAGSIRIVEIVGRVLPTRNVVGNIRDVTERRQMERGLRAIVDGTPGATGHDFFWSLVEHLATALGVSRALVAEVVEGTADRVRTLAFWRDGRSAPNIEYALPGTPCEAAITGGLCGQASDVRQAFSHAPGEVTLGAGSYLGMRLCHGAGRVLGHVAVLDSRPMADEAPRRETLAIFAARAGAEIERQRAMRQLMTLNSELEARVAERTARLQAALDRSERLIEILEATPDIVGTTSLGDGSLVYLNKAGRDLLGDESPEEIAGLPTSALFTAESADMAANGGALDETIPRRPAPCRPRPTCPRRRGHP
jgi:PAS domain-containing protein